MLPDYFEHVLIINRWEGGMRCTINYYQSGCRGGWKRESDNVLSVGSVQPSLITTPNSLGDINAVRMWCIEGGSSPDWYYLD
ncbi:unnamed protein product [Clavelina lepadiformis]|uniref:Uncharacterized protein n=1 Tax=Clavelina lepadiformis TaxID=159417 RepID=A0ABP0FZJ3_CLALP